MFQQVLVLSARVKQPEKTLHPEDEDTVILRSIRKCLLNDTASTSKKTYLFNTNSMRTSDL